ncbi:MAG: monovalent cation/H+ antiporter subunit D family protein [Gammaproteobacteria bacterium]|nr:monovalent cation/H+ antiporter subunit D family protein [Gammaproteobacteria bacterium]
MSLATQLPALQVAVPLLTAPLLVLLRGPGLAWAAACAASVMAFVIAISLTASVMTTGAISYAMGGWPGPYGIVLEIDALGTLVLLLVTGASTAALLSGRASLGLDIDAGRQHLFYAAWLIVLAGLSGIAITGDAFNVFVFMEISSLATYILIAAGPDRRALTATFKYLIMGTIGATFYLIGVGLVYMMTGTLNFADMESRIADVSDQRPILVAAGFISVGLALKAAVFPLHLWLPGAYTYAPHVVTAFLAACSTKVAIYVLLRFDFFLFQDNLVGHTMQFAVFLVPLAILGILVGSAVAMVESNLKRLLAFSSVAQIGYILLGASFANEAGLTAAVAHMFNHALAKGALFLAVAAIAMRVNGLRLQDIAGIGRRMPLTTAALAVAGASLVGVPGTAGFVSKWLLLQAAFAQGALGIAAVVVVIASSLAAVFYVWRIVECAYFGNAQAPGDAAAVVTEAPLPMLLGLWLVVIANVYFGLAPELPVSLAESAAADLLRHVP